MCNYKVLVHNENGYVILCGSCCHYQLAFGTIAVTIEPGNFKQFYKEVLSAKDKTSCNGFENQKRFSFNIFSRFAMMVLNYRELIFLSELLEEALFNEEMEGLLQDLNLIRE